MTDPALTAPDSPESPRPSWRAKLMALLLSTLFALVAAEFVFGMARGWSFDYLNIYQADATYGVRLESDAETRTRSWDGHLTDIRTNALGFRGGAWAPPIEGEQRVLLIGDSQAFGYGVAEDLGMGPRLGHHLSTDARPSRVLNAATPTWGPHEYAVATQALAPAYAPEWVVVIANVANDWDEAPQANVQRVTAQDGWVTGFDPDAERPGDFPGRRWLLGESHLVYAVRALLRDEDEAGMPQVSVDRLMGNLQRLSRPDGAYRSAITRHVVNIQRTCTSLPRPCRVAVAVLPFDAQVDPTAFEKYGQPARPLDALHVLTRALLDDARQLGVVGVDLAPALAAASPGAYLSDDYHLSPAGHDVVATTIASALTRAPSPTQRASR